MLGDVRVVYSIQSANAADLALAAAGASLFGYFSSPIRNLALMPSAILRFLTDAMLDSCARACLADQACFSFAHDVASSLCQLYLATRDSANSVFQTGPVYYEKFQAMVRPCMFLNYIYQKVQREVHVCNYVWERNDIHVHVPSVD